jgi:hypothetical protein
MGFLCCCVKQFKDKVEERTLDGIHYWRPVQIGNSYLLCGKKNGSFPRQMFVGPEWPCMVITNILIIVPTYFFIVDIAMELNIGVVIMALITGFTLLVMFSATACTDPGIVWLPNTSETQAKTPEEKMEKMEKGESFHPIEKPDVPKIMCGQCGLDRPRTAHHCYECGLCVDDLDHHCPWTGKCIANRNLQRFHYFLWSLCTHIIFVVGTLVYNISNRSED